MLLIRRLFDALEPRARRRVLDYLCDLYDERDRAQQTEQQSQLLLTD